MEITRKPLGMSVHSFNKILYGVLAFEFIADGILTNILLSKGLGSEGNPLLEPFAGSLNLLILKIIGIAGALVILWHISKTKPYLALGTTFIFILIYEAIFLWNISIF